MILLLVPPVPTMAWVLLLFSPPLFVFPSLPVVRVLTIPSMLLVVSAIATATVAEGDTALASSAVMAAGLAPRSRPARKLHPGPRAHTSHHLSEATSQTTLSTRETWKPLYPAYVG